LSFFLWLFVARVSVAYLYAHAYEWTPLVAAQDIGLAQQRDRPIWSLTANLLIHATITAEIHSLWIHLFHFGTTENTN
jgi:hypothetical protein